MKPDAAAGTTLHGANASLGAPAGAIERFLAWYQPLVLGAALFVIYANLPIYAYILSPSLLPKYSFFGIFVLLAPVAALRFGELGGYLRSPFVLLAGLLLLLNLVHLLGLSPSTDLGDIYVVDDGLDARRSLVLTRIQYVLFALALGFAAFTSTRKSWLLAMLLLTLVVPGAVLLDFARPGLLYPIDTPGAVLGRAAAMFINPNMAGEAILLVFLLACGVVPAAWRGPLFLLCGAAILTTFSRAAILAWVLLLLFLSFRKTLPKSALATALAALALAVAGLGSFETYLQGREEFEGAASNLSSRLNFFSDVKFDDDSSEERAEVIKAGWQLFLQNPVFGAGAGATGFWSLRASTHNQLLLLIAEYGLFGLGLWCWLLAILWRGRFFRDRALQFAVAGLFAFMSMFTHQMLDSASYWLATFALVSARHAGAATAMARSLEPNDKED
ncbi:O-antigen ligase family protein [Massilia sp. IC2-477]|uniref:O-antigen ligase family protein n=1 Tax=Massilia sp. IC2-477 TaxID=2887198 RepID=UPI001D111EDC|nr:O-antigen ligase family protein [Massilia sp. IC2-477]MCC2958535.1 O-antigen ligase family protein [Massilia sp. IC2-477]